MMDNYDDIIDLPHHISKVHKPMSMLSRAAQFAPFAALTGHDNAIMETARITQSLTQLCEEQRTLLDRKIAYLKTVLHETPVVHITYFVPDNKKSGGAYHTICAGIKNIDESNGIITLLDGKKIDVLYIQDIDGDFPLE